MRKLPALVSLVTVFAGVVGSFAIAACVGDDPSADTQGTLVQGELGGACFANGTCKAGLSCELLDGKATCDTASVSDEDAAAPVDGSTTPATDGAIPTVPGTCKFQTTSYPCGGVDPPKACYGAALSCTLTGCGSSDIEWNCNSARQCGTACCLAPSAGTFNPGASCAQGTLVIPAGTQVGTQCGPQVACAAGETQLCQANSDCPVGQKCTPVKVVGPGATPSLADTILAACTPL